MFSHAAFSAAFRRVAAADGLTSINLSMSGPAHPEPPIVDEEPDDHTGLDPDLGVSNLTTPRDVLPPAAALSQAQEEFRRQLLEEV